MYDNPTKKNKKSCRTAKLDDMPQHLGHKNMTLKSSNIRPRTLSVLIVLSVKKHITS